MRTMNKVFLLGVVGKEVNHHAKSGVIYTTFTMVTELRRKIQRQWNTETQWHNIVAIGSVGELAKERLSAGDPLFVMGRLKTRHWDDKETGQKRSITEIVVEEISFLAGGKAIAASSSPEELDANELEEGDSSPE